MGQCSWFPLSRAEIRTWVERHRHELPATLDELARLPAPFRAVVAARVAPEVRASLWHEHLAQVLRSRSNLSDAQRAFIVDGQASLADLLSVGGPGPALRSYEDRMRTLFTPEEARAIFGTLGPPEPPGGLPIPDDALPVTH